MKGIVLSVLLLFLTTGISSGEDVFSKGKEAFDENGCSGCHKIGTNYNGPDLSGVTTYRSKEWIIDYILNPKKHYNDPTIKAMIKSFNLYMPNQGVTKEDAELIYKYLKSIAK